MVAMATCLVLAGCGNSEHTVDWYKQHAKEAVKKDAWCRQDAARKVTGDCQNAMEAVAGNMAFGDGNWSFPDITGKKQDQHK